MYNIHILNILERKIMTSYIVDGETFADDFKTVIRTSVSVDSLIFNLYAVKCGSPDAARREIRDALKSGYARNSAAVRRMIIRDICDKDLLAEYDGSEGFFDKKVKGF